MKNWPTDPMQEHARFMQAFCADLLSRDYDCPRAKAVCEISKQLREESLTKGRGVSPTTAPRQINER